MAKMKQRIVHVLMVMMGKYLYMYQSFGLNLGMNLIGDV